MATRAKKDTYKDDFSRLNSAQKEAVKTTEGPVMVVAGPGTGKTQILALRIAFILENTGVSADSILCLTFTNSGVRAMQERLHEYIGNESGKVVINTFHSFALHFLIKKHFSLLGYDKEPEILADDEAIFLSDEILHENEWEYLRPRTNPEMYFSEIKQLISLLKREQITPEIFLTNIESEIVNLKNDPENISTRGESKGKLKKETEKKIESLERTKELVHFYELYEEKKFARGLLDYDDILKCAVNLVQEFEDVRADIYENFHYILVDEHQDSSGVQNKFLRAVWGKTENPNIFVVGDDRQLIYGFSGASLSYFNDFSHIFKNTKLIFLSENYRSTSAILSLADDLLQSSISNKKLTSTIETKHKEKITLAEYTYPREEIIGAGLYFKKKIEEGIKPEECAILVPRNYHVRSTIQTLLGMGIKASSEKNASLFDLPRAQSLLRILELVSDPYNAVLLSESVLDSTSGIPPLSAHKFLRNTKPDRITLDELKSFEGNPSLFVTDNAITTWGKKLEYFVQNANTKNILENISSIGYEILVNQSKNHEQLVQDVEIIRTLLHVGTFLLEKKSSLTMKDFIVYLKRLKSYNSHIPVVIFGQRAGVQVMTLHKSKGLEYKAVWIAHMNEEVLMSEKRNTFTLPEKIKAHIADRDSLTAKRELYVAITRARESCTISYAAKNYTEGEMEVTHILRELPEVHFLQKNANETEKEILSSGVESYILKEFDTESSNLKLLQDFVSENYPQTKISVTLLNNFFECPWKWYYRNFLKLPEIKSSPLALGSAVHNMIEFILKNKSVPSNIVIRQHIQTSLEKEGIRISTEMKKLIKDGEKAVMHFVEDFYPHVTKDFTPERPIQFRDALFPYLQMYGRIDLTERYPDGSIIITDFKTGSSKTKNVIEKLDDEGRLSPHMRQLAMYSYLLSRAEKGKEVSESRLLYLESLRDDKNLLYKTHISKEEIDLLVRDIADYDTALKEGTWIRRMCHYNSYGKNTACEYCKMAEIYKN